MGSHRESVLLMGVLLGQGREIACRVSAMVCANDGSIAALSGSVRRFKGEARAYRGKLSKAKPRDLKGVVCRGLPWVLFWPEILLTRSRLITFQTFG
jgi:hypothetical protein